VRIYAHRPDGRGAPEHQRNKSRRFYSRGYKYFPDISDVINAPRS